MLITKLFNLSREINGLPNLNKQEKEAMQKEWTFSFEVVF